MKQMVRFTIFLMLLCSSFMLLSADKTPSVNELSAIGTVNNYLGALMIGDIAQAQLFLAPNVADQRRALLNNPNYPAQLHQAYANATYEVISSKELGREQVQVNVKIALSQQDTVHSRFVVTHVNNHYRISSEQ